MSAGDGKPPKSAEPALVAVIPFRMGRCRCPSEQSASGPARVNSEAYRSGWDAIFAKPAGKKAKERPN